jgi:hypothetical protein
LFHSNTQQLIEHWSSLRAKAGAPLRSSFDPAAIAGLLPHTFMLSRAPALPFRLAGGAVEHLHGRSLRGHSFLTLWNAGSRAAARDAAAAAIRHCEPVALYAEGRSLSSEQAGLELVLAPFCNHTGAIDRLLGFYQLISNAGRAPTDPLVELTHRLTLYGAGDASQPSRMTLGAVDGRRIA